MRDSHEHVCRAGTLPKRDYDERSADHGFASRDGNTVSGFVLNFETGGLMPMEGQTFATGSKPISILMTGNIQ